MHPSRRLSIPFLLLLLLLLEPLFSQRDYVFDVDAIRARNFFNQGLGYMQDKSYEAAIKKFLLSLKIKSDNNLVRYYLGEAFYKAGYTEQALNQWENILKLGGQDALLVERINSLYYRRGAANKKKKAFEDYIKINTFPQQVATNEHFPPVSFPVQLYINNIDKENELHFLDYKQNKIGKITPNGEYIGEYFGGLSTKLLRMGQLKQPMDFVPYRGGYLVSDFGNDRLVWVNERDGLVETWGKKGRGSDSLSPVEWLGPNGIALDERGNMFVVDSGNCRVVHINPQGELLFSFAQRGRGEGELLLPAGLAYSEPEKRVYIADRGNNRIVVFDNYGKAITHFGELFLEKPRHLLLHPFDEEIAVIVDAKDVYLYHKKKEVYKSIFYNMSSATTSPATSAISPLSAVFDSAGHLYIGDGNKGKIYVYAPLKLSYVNLNVRIENLQLTAFPQVLVTVSVYNKEGRPLVGLSRQNFTLTENGIKRNFDMHTSGKKGEGLRGVVLLERGENSRLRSQYLKAFIRDLTLHLNDQDAFEFYAVGFDENPLRSYHKIIKHKDYLPVMNGIEKSAYYRQFQCGTALKRAINEQLHTSYKRGILMVVFSDYREEDFGRENHHQLIDFAKHNFVPISVVYLGEELEGEDNFALFRSLSERTGGKFFIYSNPRQTQAIIKGFRDFKDGRYVFSYPSFENDLQSGLFRKLAVKVSYKNLTGLDNKGGFPIP